MPKSLLSWALFFMAIFLYGKHINWRNLKETKSYFIKGIVVLVLAVIIDHFFLILISADTSDEFRMTVEVVFLIPIGIFWYKEHKKIKKKTLGKM